MSWTNAPLVRSRGWPLPALFLLSVAKTACSWREFTSLALSYEYYSYPMTGPPAPKVHWSMSVFSLLLSDTGLSLI